MKRKHVSTSIVIVAMILAFSTVSAIACTSLMITPGASVNGTASVTHTCDSGNSPFEIFKVPAKDWAAGTMVDVLNLPQYSNGYQMSEVAGNPTGYKIPQVAHTYGYIGALFGVINEKQVAIGETTIGGRSQNRNTAGYFDITNLSFYAMERAATAREAIKVMGQLAEKYGYKDGGEQLTIADKNEVWIFEIEGPGALWEVGDPEPGAFWVAQRIPDGCVAACANNAIIKDIVFSDTVNFMSSPGILEFAMKNGWWSPNSGKLFNWRLDFCNSTSFATSGRRVWGAYRLLAPSLVDTFNEADLPVYIKPDKKVSLDDINAIQRDHYEGTQYDARYSITAGPWENPRRFRGLGFRVDSTAYSWQRQIAQVQCEYSITTQSRAWLPDTVGACVWYGAANPDLTCYIPIYACVSELSTCLNTKAGSHQLFTRESYWWAISTVSTYANYKFSYISADVNEYIKKYEKNVIATQPIIDQYATMLYERDPQLAINFLTGFVNENVVKVRDALWELLDFLMWKYNQGLVNNGTRISQPVYPEQWVKRITEIPHTDIQ